MNSIFIRTGVAVVLLGVTWGFGYFVGADHSRSGVSHSGIPATPIPERDLQTTAAGLSSTAIGRVIAGKSEFRRQASLHQYADSLDAAAMPGAINEAMQLPLQYRNGALAVLFARWAELDPAAAAKYVDLLPASADPERLRGVVVTAWAEKDFAAALAWARALEKGTARNESLTVLAGALAGSDPAAAMNLIQENFSRRESERVFEKVFSVWAETDFAGALTAAREITDLALRECALRATLTQHIEKNPRAVFDTIRNFKVGDFRWSVGRRAIRRWLERDFAAARDYVLALPQGSLRAFQIDVLAAEMARRDPREALAGVDQLPEEDRSAVAIGIFESWGQRDSAAAMEAVRALPDGEMKQGAIGRIVQSLMETDSNTALEIFKEFPIGETRDSFASSIGSQLAEIDPARAADWYSENGSSKHRKDVLTQILAKWTRSDPNAAMEWVVGLPDAAAMGDVIQYIARELAGEEPEKVALQIEQLPIDSQRAAVRGVAQQWSFSDPEAAANWASGLRDEKAQANAMGALAGEWGNRNPIAAARWIESLPAGPARDEAVASFSERTAQRDPEGSVAWAISIEDSSKQARTMRDVFTTWLSNDPAIARNWLQSAQNIPDDLRTHLRVILAEKAGE